MSRMYVKACNSGIGFRMLRQIKDLNECKNATRHGLKNCLCITALVKAMLYKTLLVKRVEAL